MSRDECPRGAEVMSAIAAGTWPSGVDASLRGHVEACAACTEVALVAQTLRDDYLVMSAEVQLPSAGQVWWRAAVRARLESAEAAARPLTWMHGLAGAGAVGLLLALIGMAWPPVLAYATSALTSLLPRAAVDVRTSALVLALVRQSLPLLVVVALCMVIAPVAVYLATSDE